MLTQKLSFSLDHFLFFCALLLFTLYLRVVLVWWSHYLCLVQVDGVWMGLFLWFENEEQS